MTFGWPIANEVTLKDHMNGLVQDCSISSALTMEILQSCSKPSKKIMGSHEFTGGIKDTIAAKHNQHKGQHSCMHLLWVYYTLPQSYALSWSCKLCDLGPLHSAHFQHLGGTEMTESEKLVAFYHYLKKELLFHCYQTLCAVLCESSEISQWWALFALFGLPPGVSDSNGLFSWFY